jgi:hypothetical protein
LKIDDVIDGDFCEWNDYEQLERVISNYHQKIKYNQNVFQTTNDYSTNSPGFYYKSHNPMTIRVFSDYVETGDVNFVEQVPQLVFLLIVLTKNSDGEIYILTDLLMNLGTRG